jgi:hypothetical protein
MLQVNLVNFTTEAQRHRANTEERRKKNKKVLDKKRGFDILVRRIKFC